MKDQRKDKLAPNKNEILDILHLVEELAIFGFWEWNVQTGDVLWSDNLFTLFGRNKEDFEPSYENFLNIVHEKDKTYVSEKIMEAVEKKITLDYYFTGVLPSGEEKYFQTWGGLKQDSEGNPLLVRGVVIDFTEKISIQKEVKKLNEELKEKNEALHSTNKELKKKHDEQLALTKEIHHRVKNNLQIVNSLLRFQASKIEDHKLLNVLSDIETRIFTISALHEKLYKTQDLRKINISEHFNFLIKELVKSINKDIDINMSIEIDKVNLSLEQLIPMGLILNELVSNSVKHGFKNRTEGNISFEIKRRPNKTIEVNYRDDGVGIDPNLKMREDAIGIELVSIFTEQLDAEMIRLDVGGTHYKLKFKEDL